MDKDFNFKVILLKINEQSLEFQQTVASLLAATFNVPEQETANLFARLPIVLLENLTSNDLKAIKDQLIFLSKLGLDFNITPKPVANIPRTGWSSERALPIIHCPSCGESFCLLRAQDFHKKIHKQTKIAPAPRPAPTAPPKKAVAPPPAPPKKVLPPTPAPVQPTIPPAARKPATIKVEQPPQPAPSAAPRQQPTPPPSRPRTSVDKPKSVLPAKQEDLGGISAEFDKVEILSAELQSIVDKDDNFEELEEIEEVGSISEEMEEIGSVSEELEELGTLSEEMEKIGGMADQIKDDSEFSEIEGVGGISAEFEEIEGVSAEFEGINLDDMDNDIGSLSAELEEIEGISAEFDSIESEEGLERIGEVSEAFNNIAIATNHHEAAARHPAADHELDDLEGISQELEKIPGRSTPKTKGGKGQSVKNRDMAILQFETGNYKVMINFAGKGDIKAGSQLLATLRGITPQEAYQLAERQAAIIVAGNISQKAAENLLRQFQRFGMQGRIVAG